MYSSLNRLQGGFFLHLKAVVLTIPAADLVIPSFPARRSCSAHLKYSATVSGTTAICGPKQHKKSNSTDTEQATYLSCVKNLVRVDYPRSGTLTTGIKKPALHGYKNFQLGQFHLSAFADTNDNTEVMVIRKQSFNNYHA